MSNNFKQSPTLNPAVFNGFDKTLDGSNSLTTAKATLNQMGVKLKNLVNLKNVSNPMQTPAQNLKAWHERANSAREMVSNDLIRFETVLQSELSEINSQINEKAKLEPTAVASEIRAKFSSLTDKEKRQALNSGDPEILAAVLSANPFLSGISKAEQDMSKDGYIRKVAPELVEKREALTKVRDRFHSAIKAFDGSIRKLEDPEGLREVETKAAQYQQALEQA